MLYQRLCCLAILLAAASLAPAQEHSPPKAFVDTDACTETLYNSLRAGHVARHDSRPHSR